MGQKDWDDKVSAILWAHRTTYKRLNKATPFQLVFGSEAILPIEFMLPYLRIMRVGGLADEKALDEWIENMVQLDEHRAIARWSQKQEKACQKA